MIDMLEQMTQFLILVSAGHLFGKLSKQKGSVRGTLTDIILNLLLPCNIVVSFINASIEGEAAFAMLGVAVGSVAYTMIIFPPNRFPYRRFSEDEQPSLKCATMITDCVSLGTQLCESMYRATGMMLSSIYQIPERIVIWIFVPLYYDRQSVQSPRAVSLCLYMNSCVLAVLIGLGLILIHARPPEILMDSLEKLGNCSIPLSMVMIGMVFADMRLCETLSRKTVYFCLIRLIAIPVLVMLLYLPFRGILPTAIWE